MAISTCDICTNVRPGSSGVFSCLEGFFCHPCRGAAFDPYCEIDDAIEAVENRLELMYRTASSNMDWSRIAFVEATDLELLYKLKAEAVGDGIMKDFDRAIAMIRQMVEAA